MPLKPADAETLRDVRLALVEPDPLPSTTAALARLLTPELRQALAEADPSPQREAWIARQLPRRRVRTVLGEWYRVRLGVALAAAERALLRIPSGAAELADALGISEAEADTLIAELERPGRNARASNYRRDGLRAGARELVGLAVGMSGRRIHAHGWYAQAARLWFARPR